MVNIISEIHPQHGGDIAVASEMIRQSARPGVDRVGMCWYYDGQWPLDGPCASQVTRLGNLKGAFDATRR